MTNQEKAIHENLMRDICRCSNPYKARFIHSTLNVKQPYGLWLHHRVLSVWGKQQPDDYYFAMYGHRRECILSNEFALEVAISSSPWLQVEAARMMSERFAGQNPIDVINHGIAVIEGERILKRELDPEKSNEQRS